MKFVPKTEDEAMAEQLCAPGKAPFTVLEAKDGKSKAGDPMMTLKLNVHADDGYDWHVYDYISPEWMAHKFRHFFFSVGMGPQYEAGEVSADVLQGREGWCEVGIQKGKDGFPPKNTIQDYIIGTTASNPAPARAADPSDEEDPFR